MLTLPTSALLRTLSATASGCFLAGDAMALPLAPDLDMEGFFCLFLFLYLEEVVRGVGINGLDAGAHGQEKAAW